MCVYVCACLFVYLKKNVPHCAVIALSCMFCTSGITRWSMLEACRLNAVSMLVCYGTRY